MLKESINILYFFKIIPDMKFPRGQPPHGFTGHREALGILSNHLMCSLNVNLLMERRGYIPNLVDASVIKILIFFQMKFGFSRASRREKLLSVLIARLTGA